MSLSLFARGSKKPSRSASTSTIVFDSARGRHDLRIDGPSFVTGALAPTGQFVASSAFTVGGHQWCVKYYPNGYSADSAGHISVYLTLAEEPVAGEVTAVFYFTLLAERRGAFFLTKTQKVQSKPPTRFGFSSEQRSCGYAKFTKRDALLNLGGRKGDSFTIRCQLVVISGIRTEEGVPKTRVHSVPVPPSDLHRHLGHLLETKKGTDVVFDVGGQTFAAHRFVLAARSPVFCAELFSEMKESEAGGVVRIDDMEPGVFQALLCFAYTDSLPTMKKEDAEAMYQHLLVAADRYGMERLKLMCENMLCKCIDVRRAATILTLAEQHRCDGLKKACLSFLKSPANLKVVVASDGFEHLCFSCPSIKKICLSETAS